MSFVFARLSLSLSLSLYIDLCVCACVRWTNFLSSRKLVRTSKRKWSNYISCNSASNYRRRGLIEFLMTGHRSCFNRSHHDIHDLWVKIDWPRYDMNSINIFMLTLPALYCGRTTFRWILTKWLCCKCGWKKVFVDTVAFIWFEKKVKNDCSHLRKLTWSAFQSPVSFSRRCRKRN